MPVHSKAELGKFKKTCEDVVNAGDCATLLCENCPFDEDNNGHGVECDEIAGNRWGDTPPYAKKFLEGKIVFYEGRLVEVEDD